LGHERVVNKSKNDDEKVTIRLDLEGESAQIFNKVKNARGVANNTELVRILLKEEYNRLPERQIVPPVRR